MTVEAVLLLILAVMLMLGFTKPAGTFLDSSPKLGARIEKQMAVGSRWNVTESRTPIQWTPPPKPEPSSEFKR